MTRPPREPLATAAEVAEYLRWSRGALYVRRHRGAAPPAVKVGHQLRWRWEDVDDWLRLEEGGIA